MGRVQREVLRALVQHGYWYGHGIGCGWVWDTLSGTRRVMEALTRRGLAYEDEHGHTRPTAAGLQLVADTVNSGPKRGT